MKKEESKKKNIKFLLLGHLFLGASLVILSFFLPYFLKEKGLSILEIGVLFTIGLAFGSLIVSVLYSKILKKLKLKTGLAFSSFFSFISNFLVFLFPTSGGVLGSKISSELEMNIQRVSEDVTLQHNIYKNRHRKIGSSFLIIEGLAFTLGTIIALLTIPLFGFFYSFLIFSFLSLIPLFFYLKIKDKTRFKAKKKVKLSELSMKLKLFLFSEILYWLALASSFTLVITFLITDKFSESFVWIGYLFIAVYGSIVITTFLTRKFFDKKDLTKTSILGMFILFISALIIIFSTNIWTILGAFILEGIGAAIWVPSKSAVYWKLTPKDQRENVSGYLSGFTGFVKALGPLVGGVLVVTLGILAPFYFKALLSLIVIGIYVYILRKS